VIHYLVPQLGAAAQALTVWTEAGELFAFRAGVSGQSGHGRKQHASAPGLVEAPVPVAGRSTARPIRPHPGGETGAHDVPS